MTILETLKSLFCSGRTFSEKELLRELSLAPQDADLLRGALKQLLRDHAIYLSEHGKYGLPEAFSLLRGTLQGTRGEACFFLPQDQSEDLYIAGPDLQTALPGDSVWVRRLPENGGHHAQGRVAAVVARAHETLVGTLMRSGKQVLLVPDHPRLHFGVVITGRTDPLPNGYKAVCRIRDFTPDSAGNLKGTVVELLGDRNAPGTDILSIIKAHGLADSFPPAVLRAAEAAAAEPLSAVGRQDFRTARVFTIDGEESKDLDDAVSIEAHEDGSWTLGVHIADVSHYVRAGSTLDREACKRGTSVYFPDRVLPMLPVALSNGICSLNPGEDRLTLSVMMAVSPRGDILSAQILPSVIRSCERLTYRTVAELLRGDKALAQRYAHIRRDLFEMERLHRVLYARRVRRGSIDFDLPETHITLGADGKPVSIEPAVREVSHCIIEEFMLAANEAVARFMQQNRLPCVYRVHETPDPEKLAAFNETVGAFGYRLNTEKAVTPLMCAQLLRQARGSAEETLVSRLLLRSMKKARYCEEDLGHFGLAAEDYLHFTSPIRRYPDLLVHRALHAFWEQNHSALNRLGKRTADLAQQCSQAELTAQDAERDADDLKKAEFMAGHVGDVFEGIISGVSANAFWVELTNSAEGVVALSSLHDDYYVFYEKLCAVIGERTRRVFRFGDPVRVRVHGVDVASRRIELEIIRKP